MYSYIINFSLQFTFFIIYNNIILCIMINRHRYVIGIEISIETAWYCDRTTVN